MKVGDLIKILQSLNPESNISLSLGRDDEYRKKCAKAELAYGECLGFLTVDRIEVYSPRKEAPEMWADIVLEQNNICYLDEAVKEFHDQYIKKEFS